MEPLHKATDDYLIRLQNLLEQQKSYFTGSQTGDKDYDKITAEANQKVIKRINDAISDINNLRKRLAQIAKNKVERVKKNQPRS